MTSWLSSIRWTWRLDSMIKASTRDEVNDVFRAMKVGEVARSVIIHGSDDGVSQGYSSRGG